MARPKPPSKKQQKCTPTFHNTNPVRARPKGEPECVGGFTSECAAEGSRSAPVELEVGHFAVALSPLNLGLATTGLDYSRILEGMPCFDCRGG